MAETKAKLYDFAQKFACVAIPASAVAKYGTLIFGVSEMLKDKTDVGDVIFAGAIYSIASSIDYFARNGITGLQGEILEEKINHLEEKLNK